MTRPKHTRKDANHRAVVAELRRRGLVVIETADLPGHPEHNPLDLFVFRLDPHLRAQYGVMVATTADQIDRAASLGTGAWLQVELKPDIGAPFTENEEAYLLRLGLWPPTIG